MLRRCSRRVATSSLEGVEAWMSWSAFSSASSKGSVPRCCGGRGGGGGHGHPVLVECRVSRGGVPWGGARLSPRHVLRGGLPLPGHRAGRGGGQRASGLLGAEGPRHLCVRPWSAHVVSRLPRRALCGLAASGLRGGLPPRPLRRAGVGRGLPWTRVRGVWSSR